VKARAKWMAGARRLLGVRRGFEIDGVYYKELTSEPLRHALAKGGSGHKDFRVTFGDGSKQVIRCSHVSVFADVMGPIGLKRLDPLLRRVRPGSRVLEMGAGTGYRALWLSFAVGPSGGVVALCELEEHAQFARKRYLRENIGFEVGELFSLAGETDGAFDAIVVFDLRTDDPDVPSLLEEFWRLLAPGGGLLLGTVGPDLSDPDSRAGRERIDRLVAAILSDGEAAAQGELDVIVTKPRAGASTGDDVAER